MTLPGWKDKPASGVIGGYNLAINAYSKNPDAALAFADFVTAAEAAEEVHGCQDVAAADAQRRRTTRRRSRR